MAKNDKKEDLIELRATGMSYQKIADEIGVSKRTLINWGKKLNYEIANARAVELEALQDEYFMLKERRIKLFGEKLKAISEEIESRDLSDIKTEKLFDLFFRMYTLLEKEAVNVTFKSDEEIEYEKSIPDLPIFGK